MVRVAESALYEKQYRHDRSGLRGREAEASFKNWFALYLEVRYIAASICQNPVYDF